MTNRFWTWFSAAFVGGAACATVAGCGGDELPTPATCPEENQIRGVCVGVPKGVVYGGESCLKVANDEQLTSAALGASPGTCIVLGQGGYRAVTVPGGVSLIGASADAVTIDGITLEPGAGAVVRGLTVGQEGVSVKGATGVRIDSVRIVGARDYPRDGVEILEGSSVDIVNSEIVGSGRVGVFAMDSNVSLERSVVSGAQGGGIVVERREPCDEVDCTCTSRPALMVKSSVIRRNHIVGVSLHSATASLEDVDVIKTENGDLIQKGEYGGGISAAECSTVHRASKVRVLGSRSYGILIDRSMAWLGDEHAEDDFIEIGGNTLGLWIQNTLIPAEGSPDECYHHETNQPCTVTLHNGKLERNFGVGIGVAGESKGIILCKSSITHTANHNLEIIEASGLDRKFGDGVEWLDGSEVFIDGLTLGGNARNSLLIDGPAVGEIKGLRLLSAADELPLQQNVTEEAAHPTAMDVELRTTLESKFAIARSPIAASRPSR
ncbi:right-handed parallel beta-helix repeat-containing protein [Sorangium sp. KYC3313]|uniref:right-handed parallel beta-helix repeat-containing protein n=1 Tax=Sorangium sp. KYC3313 TaxID=3449740 RepID=UPI003F8B5CC8